MSGRTSEHMGISLWWGDSSCCAAEAHKEASAGAAFSNRQHILRALETSIVSTQRTAMRAMGSRQEVCM